MVLGLTVLTLNMKGLFEFDLESGKIGFKFNMYAYSITEKELGVGISEVLKFDNGRSMESLLYYFWGGYQAWCKLNSVEGVNIVLFGDILEEIGLEKLLSVYTQSLGVYSKNGQTPKEAEVSPLG
jgi:hypothetical protein